MRRPAVPKEAEEARWLMEFCDRFKWGRWVHHSKNEVASGKRIHGAIAKGAGVRKGYPDYLLDRARWGWFGLRVELKRQGYLLSDVKLEQREWLEELRAEGYLALTAGGWREAGAYLRWYAEGPPTARFTDTGPEYSDGLWVPARVDTMAVKVTLEERAEG